MEVIYPLLLFIVLLLALMAGYPVALTIAGVSLLMAGLGSLLGVFDPIFLNAFPNRIFGLMQNQTLVAVPAFIFMGAMLERAKIADDLLMSLGKLFGSSRTGLPIAVILVGTLLAASTGIVGATVVTMGLLAYPAMRNSGYSAELSSGTICAAGTLGQIVPPSIALVLLADVLSNANQQAQLSLGNYSPETVSVGDLFLAAIVPSILLVIGYCLYVLVRQALLQRKRIDHSSATVESIDSASNTKVDAPIRWLLIGFPIVLMVVVLGSILTGLATPTEASAMGAIGASLIALARHQLTRIVLRDVVYRTAHTTAMVFLILIAAALFSLVFRGFGGDEAVRGLLTNLPGGLFTSLLAVMLLVFILGFMLDFIEITFVVVPIVAPVLIAMGASPVWLGVMLALNLQTSFLTPPFGFALFYLRGVTGDQLRTYELYKGVAPYIVIQLLVLVLIALFPQWIFFNLNT